MSDDQNKLAYSGAQDLSISPDGPIGTPAVQGSLSDTRRSANIFFSESPLRTRASPRSGRAGESNPKKGCGYGRSQEKPKAGCGSQGAL